MKDADNNFKAFYKLFKLYKMLLTVYTQSIFTAPKDDGRQKKNTSLLNQYIHQSLKISFYFFIRIVFKIFSNSISNKSNILQKICNNFQAQFTRL